MTCASGYVKNGDMCDVAPTSLNFQMNVMMEILNLMMDVICVKLLMDGFVMRLFNLYRQILAKKVRRTLQKLVMMRT